MRYFRTKMETSDGQLELRCICGDACGTWVYYHSSLDTLDGYILQGSLFSSGISDIAVRKFASGQDTNSVLRFLLLFS